MEHCSRIRRLWDSGPVQSAYRSRARFQLVECARYFLSRCEQVLLPEYVPSDQDIVQVRVKTTGIIEHDFEISMQGGGSRRKEKLILVGLNSVGYS